MLYTVHYSSAHTTVASMKIRTQFSAADIEILTPEERIVVDSFSCESRKCEFISVRIVLKKILGDSYSPITYNANGKPHTSHYAISISHSPTMVAIIVSDKYNVAIDIEEYRSSLATIAPKVMNDRELEACTTIEEYTLVWSAKEVMYKLYNNNPDYKKYYNVLLPTNLAYTKIKAQLCSPTLEVSAELSYFCAENFCIVWTELNTSS